MVDPFDIISLNLERIGAIPVEEYLNSSKYDTLPVNYDLNFISNTEAVRKTPEKPTQDDVSAPEESFELLTSRFKACFPNYPIEDTLKWSFEEDTILIMGKTHKTWRAKLTIIKPSGESMSIHSSQSMDIAAVQVDAARKAIKSGALDFIAPSKTQTCQTFSDQPQQTHPVEYEDCLHADVLPSEPVQRDLLSKLAKSEKGLTKLDKAARRKEKRQKKKREKREATMITTSDADNEPAASELLHSPGAIPGPFRTPNTTTTSAIEEIEAILAAHKHQNPIVRWYRHAGKPQDKECGFALFIKLSNTLYHVYSTPSIYTHEGIAKEACSEVALREGFPEFMRSSKDLPYSAITDDSDTVIDLQQFYESLSKPFRESFGNKSAHEIQATHRLNTTVDRARGSQLVCSFHSIRRNGGDNLVGHLLRLERGTETMSYLVEPRFRKEKDAKAAVCLQAMALGIGDYLRSLEVEVASRVTQQMKNFAIKILQILPDPSTHIKFMVQRDAYGATLHMESDVEPPEGGKRNYSVPCEYRSKADAETAVLCVGAIEFFKFGTKPLLPPGYLSTLANEAIGVLDDQKRRAQERLEAEPGEVVFTNNGMMTPFPDGTSGNSWLPQGFKSSLPPSQYLPSGHSYSPFAESSAGQTMVDSTPGPAYTQELMRLRSNAEKSRPIHGQKKRPLELKEHNLTGMKKNKVSV